MFVLEADKGVTLTFCTSHHFNWGVTRGGVNGTMWGCFTPFVLWFAAVISELTSTLHSRQSLPKSRSDVISVLGHTYFLILVFFVTLILMAGPRNFS